MSWILSAIFYALGGFIAYEDMLVWRFVTLACTLF